ncbi:MAG: putative aminohydrolase SsnA [Candidatus Euphemobacter frigidus]|nr:putative aminohydrolase SsnA [Candidatus Euphemobacter frigidus]MDP8276097.1 putative aminohydrolase SsnA [Candidatus Euphemobacter frigidus]
MNKDLIVGNGVVITLGEDNKIEKKSAVLIRDGLIEAVGADSEIRPGAPEAEYIDAGGKLIMPGFINAHHHLYSTFARGLAPHDPPPYTFVEILERMWWPLDKVLEEEDIYYSALIPLIDCVKKGATTIIDHHESQGYQLGSLDQLARAAREIGIRSSLCLGISDRYGKGEEGIEENVRFIEKVQSASPAEQKMLTGMFGIHAAFTVNDDTLDRAVAAADRLGVGFHIHVAEAASDEEDSVEKYGLRILERLNEKGALGPKSLAIHCVHINDREMDILKETGTAAVHNPESNMNNAVGVAPVLEMMERGIQVGLGTDAMTSNMCKEVQIANLLQHLEKRDPRVAFVESCQLLLENNPKIASRLFDQEVGVLKPGAAGDVIVIDYIPPTPLNEDNFLGHFLFGICETEVITTVVNGKVLMKDKELIGIDEEKIAARSRELAAKFLKRF